MQDNSRRERWCWCRCGVQLPGSVCTVAGPSLNAQGWDCSNLQNKAQHQAKAAQNMSKA
jgi:hypothetical protein